MLRKFTVEDLDAIATRVYAAIEEEPTQVQIAVLMASLAVLIKHSVKHGGGVIPSGVTDLLPLLDANVYAAIYAFETVGVNVGTAH